MICHRRFKSWQLSRRIKSKFSILLVSILMLFIVVQGTVAFLLDQTSPVENKFTPTTITVEVEEILEQNEKNDVKVRNTGNADAYIRATVVATWVDKSGNVYSKTPVLGIDYEFMLPATEQWVKGEDDFYYYTNKVKSNDVTTNLFTKCHMLENANIPDGFELSVEILAQGVQADGVNDKNEHPVELAWGVLVKDDGTICVQ